jgi:hypothetical protein
MVAIDQPRQHDHPPRVDDPIRLRRQLGRRAHLLDDVVTREHAAIRNPAALVVHRHQQLGVS